MVFYQTIRFSIAAPGISRKKGRLFMGDKNYEKNTGKIIGIIVAIALVLALVIYLAARNSNKEDNGGTTKPTASAQSSNTDKKDDTTQEQMNGNGNLGAHHVEIKDYRMEKDKDGKNSIIITYKITNNDNAVMNFATILRDKAYQGTKELKDAVLENIENFDADSITKSIEKGATHEVQKAFVLENTETAVKIEVKRLTSTNGESVVKTFDIKE